MKACSECSKNCILIPQLKAECGSSAVTSFFKVMFCDSYSELMYLPPKCNASLSKLINQKINLEDSHGHRWPVMISKVDGALAFKRGWNAFFLDHGLQLGDFVLFFYLGDHLAVKIYDKTGCEKLDFPNSNASKKRRRPKKGSKPIHPSKPIDRKSLSPAVVTRLTDDVVEVVPQNDNPPNCTNGRSQEKPKECVEDWFIVSDPVTKNKHVEDRRLLFDLSDFEMNFDILCASGSKETTVENDNLSQEPKVGDKLEIEVPVTNQPNIGIFKTNDVATEDTEHRKAPKEPDNLCHVSDSASRNKQKSEHQLPNTVTIAPRNEKSHMLNAGIKELKDAKERGASAAFSGEALKAVEKEPFQVSPNMRSLSEIIPKTYVSPLKIELEAGSLDIVPISSLSDDPIEVFGIADNPFYIELPWKLAQGRGKSRHRKKVIALQDPQKRLWPVVYYERSDLKILTTGWKHLYKANEIQPGDKCAFKLLNKLESIYAVSIIREPAPLLLPAP
ncbi:hypothetical protein CRG98_029235 [Punica granatum]|uniref:TF-B3 domain-containing protein n=1 Tax=Punica granatum TaxID=22663 RepID=A0A2I0J290_PUNGR|nr:hypothetical protein CRG98_029235 [Punica granatum]